MLEIINPNYFLGIPQALTSWLALAVVFSVGSLLVVVLSRMVDVPLGVPITILLGYLAIGLASYLILGPFSFTPDARTYDEEAVTIASNLGLEAPYWFSNPTSAGKTGFSTLLGWTYGLIGRTPLAGIGFNCILCALTSILIMLTSRKLFGRIDSTSIVAVFLFAPSFFTLGPNLLREPLCWLGLAAVCFGLSTWLKLDGYVAGTLLGVIGIGLLLWARTTLGYLVLLSIVIALAVGCLWRLAGSKALWVSLLCGLAVIIVFGEFALNFVGYSSEYVLAARASNASTAVSGYQVYYGPLALFGIPGAVIASIPNVIFGPFPWEIGPQLVWAWVLASGLFWWWGVIAVARSIRRSGLSFSVLFFVTMALVLLIGMAAFLTSYGVLVRLRATPMIIMLILIPSSKVESALGMFSYKSRPTTNQATVSPQVD